MLGMNFIHVACLLSCWILIPGCFVSSVTIARLLSLSQPVEASLLLFLHAWSFCFFLLSSSLIVPAAAAHCCSYSVARCWLIINHQSLSEQAESETSCISLSPALPAQRSYPERGDQSLIKSLPALSSLGNNTRSTDMPARHKRLLSEVLSNTDRMSSDQSTDRPTYCTTAFQQIAISLSGAAMQNSIGQKHPGDRRSHSRLKLTALFHYMKFYLII